ncbi:hypothetical protein I7I53_06575 [Histoplasma capsulatum var. duboisii H88]|uniref:Uncharacterized protein n=1 Tax=Ajellomyces capsulatus (strain H88) TaxID=544711 RepID=A0A8A1LCF7_AJEC8|nr:hypothetical protein I7I53_06575 [Histoplasma capsulatum var. duboisii H88]
MCPDTQMNSQLAAAFITQAIGAANPEEGMVHCPWIARPKVGACGGRRYTSSPPSVAEILTIKLLVSKLPRISSRTT